MIKGKTDLLALSTYFGLAVVFWLSSFAVFKLGDKTNVPSITLEDEVSSYAKSNFPKIYSDIQAESGVKLSLPVLLSADRNFITNSAGYQFAVEDQPIWLFEFTNAGDLEKAKEGFTYSGYKYTDLVTGVTTSLLFENEPHFYTKDNDLVIFAGDNSGMERRLAKAMGTKVVIPAQTKEVYK